MSVTAQHISNEFADMACNGVQWLRNIRDGINTVEEALIEMEANMARIRGLQAEKHTAEQEELAAAERIQANKWVKGYYRSYTTWDGKHIKNEYTAFSNSYRIPAQHDGLLRRDAAMELIARWNYSGNGKHVYSLEPQP